MDFLKIWKNFELIHESIQRDHKLILNQIKMYEKTWENSKYLKHEKWLQTKLKGLSEA